MSKSPAAKVLLVTLGVILILGGSCAGLLGVSNLGGPALNAALVAAAVAAVVGGVLAIARSRK
jgi:hypothetical protein